MKTQHYFTLSTLVLASAGSLTAQTQYFQAPTGPGDTWNVYQVDFGAYTQKDALAAAAADMQDHDGNGSIAGHVVTITSDLENEIIWRWGNRGNIWLGLTDREGVAPGAEESQTVNDGITGWAWVTGEAFTYHPWGGGEPNDFGGIEDAAHLRSDGLWNDHKSGFLADEPIAPTIQPGTSGDESIDAPAFNFVTEWETNAANAIPGIRTADVFGDMLSPTRIPGPQGSAGLWGIREIRNTPASPGNVFDAIDAARNPDAGATIQDGSFDLLDVNDPDTSTNPTGSVAGFLYAFLTNDLNGVAADDDNIVTIAHGVIEITEAGDYTFQIRSDDGFAFRIQGQDIVALHGPAEAGIDPLASDTAFFRSGTGDANTRIVYNLPVGKHEIEFIHWEGGGGAYYEVSSAKGNIAGNTEANWILVGDDTFFTPEEFFVDPVLLSGDVTVYKEDLAPSGIANTISLLDTEVTNGTVDFTSTEVDTLFGEAELAGTDDNYQLRVDGQFTVDDGDATPGETIDLTFTLRTDDGSALHIIGGNFTATAGNAGGALLAFGADTGLAADFNSGNTDVLGHIQLTEGVTYNFQAYMFEVGGGSRFELQASLGHLTAFDGAQFHILDTMSNNFLIPANQGLALVDPDAPSADLEITACDRSATGDFDLTFSSEAATNYLVEASTTLEAGSWTTLTTTAGAAGSTNLTLTDAEIKTALSVDPAPEKLFFRVKEQ